MTKPIKKVKYIWTCKVDTWLWKWNKEWIAQEIIPLNLTWKDKRAQELLTKYDLWDTYKHRVNMWNKHKIKYEVAICIAKADTNLWKQLKTRNNLGNIGNNDRWNKVHFASQEQWIEHIYLALNNKALWQRKRIGELSIWWRNELGIKKKNSVYASSPDNWNNNVINCLRNIYQDYKINENFKFRLK